MNAALIALVRKDLVLYFADRRALIMSIVAPIVIAAFFGSLFGNGDSKPAHIEVALTDLDQSELSKQIVAALGADPTFTVIAADEGQAAELVKAGKVPAAIVFPAGFGAQAGRALFGTAPKPELVLRYDPSQAMALQVVRGLLAQHVMQHVTRSALSGASPLFADLRERALHDASMPEDRRRALSAMFDSIATVQGPAASASPNAAPASGNGSGFTIPYATREVEAGGVRPERKYNSYSHSFVGMGVQFVLLMGVDIGIGLLAMRRLGLWKRLRAAPLSRGTLLASRIVSCALIALFSMTAVFAVAIAAFGVRIDGSALGFVGVLIAFALMTAGFGLLIAAIGRTPEATRGLAILATLLLVMLGGAWVPSFIFPAWLQKISLFVPTRWAVDGLDAMTWRGLPFDAALPSIGVLLGFAALFAALAVWRFDWEE
jgi:ABC-2 type transport system permease protein